MWLALEPAGKNDDRPDVAKIGKLVQAILATISSGPTVRTSSLYAMLGEECNYVNEQSMRSLVTLVVPRSKQMWSYCACGMGDELCDSCPVQEALPRCVGGKSSRRTTNYY